jgi:hypothetical protein
MQSPILLLFLSIILSSCTGIVRTDDNNTKTQVVKELKFEQKGDHSCGMYCGTCHYPWTDVTKIKKLKPCVDSARSVESPNIICIAGCGDIDGVNELINAGVDVHYSDFKGISPLHTSSAGGFTNVVKALIKAGADVNIKTKIGGTPLMGAVFSNNFETVKVLLEAGADVNITTNKGFSALSFADFNAKNLTEKDEVMKIIKLLKDAGAKPSKTFIRLIW